MGLCNLLKRFISNLSISHKKKKPKKNTRKKNHQSEKNSRSQKDHKSENNHKKKNMPNEEEINPYKDPLFLFIMNHRLPIVHGKGVTARNALEQYYKELCASLCEAVESEAVNSKDDRFVDDGCYDELSNLLPMIEKICSDIISVFDLYDRCESGQMVQKVDDIMSACRPHLLIQKMSKLYPHSDEESVPGGGAKTGFGSQDDIFAWYRVRPGKYEKRSDLFHVPWNKRDKISSGRYSIEGQPCLYLSSAPQIAWFEMGMPKEASISTFLDLPGRIYSLQKEYDKKSADLEILKSEAPNEKQYTEILEKEIEEIGEELDPLKKMEKAIGDSLHPCRVLDFTAPFSNRHLPNASQDFEMKMLGEYNQCKAPAWQNKPYQNEAGRVIFEIQGAKVTFPEYSLKEVNDRMISYIVMLPLIAACSIVVNDTSAKFKQEYVFSQQVLLWVMRQKDIDGIAYRSCSKYEDSRYLNAFDVVLPADDLPLDGIKFSPKLMLTFPLSKPGYIKVSDYITGMKDKADYAKAFIDRLRLDMQEEYFDPYEDMDSAARNAVIIYDALANDSYESGEAITANLEVLSKFAKTIQRNKEVYLSAARNDNRPWHKGPDSVKTFEDIFNDFDSQIIPFIDNLYAYADGAVIKGVEKAGEYGYVDGGE